MTDNEKRAHDLAISMIPVLCENATNRATENGDSSISFKAYVEYINMYNTALESFNHDFPDSK